MNDIEFDLLDELYFVTSFADICRQSGYGEEVVKEHLKRLLIKQFIKILKTPDEELPFQEDEYDLVYSRSYYLATKSGLKHHNGIS